MFGRLSYKLVLAFVVVLALVVGVAAAPSWSAATLGVESAPGVQGPTPTVWGTGASSGKPTTKPSAGSPQHVVSANGEVAALRTRNSRTFERANRMQTVISTAPVNYRSKGVWVPIDTTLARQPDGSFDNTADAMQASLPATSAGTVQAVEGGASVGSTLVGARAVDAVVSGSTATYPSVYPGVDAVFAVRADTVEETLRLASASVPASFSSTVTVADGSSLRAAADGSLSVLGADGTLQGSLPAPVMTDSSGDLDYQSSTQITYTVTGAAPKYTVTVTPSHAWLSDPARVFPVLLDPTVVLGASLDLGCRITNPGTGTPPADPVLCAGNTGTDNPLSYGSTAYVRRIFMNFGDLSSTSSPIPADAVITDADLALTELSATSATTMDSELLRPTASWNSGITWANQPATSGYAQDQVTVTPPGVGNTVTFKPVRIVQDFVNGTVRNDGLELRLTSEAPSNTLNFYGFANATHAPTLTVTWSPVTGQQSAIGAYDHQLSDRSDVHVDVADRNLVVNGTDESMTGPGQSLLLRRTYNSLTAAAGTSGAFGLGWSMNGGLDNSIVISRAHVTVSRASGALAVFNRNFSVASLNVKYAPTGQPSYYAAPGVSADLTKPDTTHFKLTMRKEKTVYTYTLAGPTSTTATLTSVDDGNGNHIDYTSTGGQSTTVTDTTGSRSLGLTYTSATVTGMAETLAAGATGARSWSYTYSSGNLSTAVDPAGQTTRYCYTSNLLTKIITARGSASGATCVTTQGTDVTDIAYDTGGKVASITYQNGTAAAITVAFTTSVPLNPGGTSGETTFTDPYGKTTHYTYDTFDRVTKTVTPLGYPAATTYNGNSDVTASITPANYTGGGSDPTSTTSFTGDNNPTNVRTPTGASVSATYGGSDANQPDKVSDDRDPTGGTSGASATSYAYNGGGQITSVGKGGTTVTVKHEGDSGYSTHCGPGVTPVAAYKGAVCETRDADYATANPAQHRTAYRYDALGQTTTMTTAQPAATARPNWTYTYDSHSRVTSVADARAKTTSFTYDTLDRLTRTTYNDGHYTAYTWDEDGNRLTAQDYTAAGVAVTGAGDTYTYDNLNRTATETPNGQPTTTTSWDANSRMLSVDDGSGTGAVNYGYNDDGALTSMVEPGGDCTGFSLASGGTLPTATSNCILFDVDKNGRRKRTVLPGDFAEQNQTYDSDGHIASVTGTAQNAGAGTTLYAFAYSYLNGAVTTSHIYKRTNSGSTAVLGVGGGSTVSYAYDTAARLSTATDKSSAGTTTGQALYCYDNNDNRTSTSTTIGDTCPGTSTYAYDGANQTTGTSNTYDLDGDETSAATSLPAASTVRASTWTDAQQQASTTLNGGTTLNNTYYNAGNTQLLTADTAAGEQDQLTNTNTGVQSIAHTGPSGAPSYHAERDPAGTLIALRDAATGNEHYPLTDNLGSVWAVVDNTGNTVDAHRYDAFGVRTTVRNTYPQGFGYTGAYTNPGTGLIHLGARNYDPTLARFTQTDPQAHPTDTSQTSPYPYAGNDPINNTDPSGHGWGTFFADLAFSFGIDLGCGALALVTVGLAAPICFTVAIVGAAAIVNASG